MPLSTNFARTIAYGDDKAVRDAIHSYFLSGSASYDQKVIYLVKVLTEIKDSRGCKWAETMISIVLHTCVNLTQGQVPVIISKMMYEPLKGEDLVPKKAALIGALKPLLKGRPSRELREKISKDVAEVERACTKSTWLRLLYALEAEKDFSDIVAMHPNVLGWQIADKESAADSRPHVGIYSFLVR